MSFFHHFLSTVKVIHCILIVTSLRLCLDPLQDGAFGALRRFEASGYPLAVTPPVPPTLKTCVCPGIVLNRSSKLSWLLWSPLVKTVIFHFHCFWESVLNWSWLLKWQIVVKKYRCISFSYAEFDLPNSSLIAENTKATKNLETVQVRLLV